MFKPKDQVLLIAVALLGILAMPPMAGAASEPPAPGTGDAARVPERPWWMQQGATTTPPPATEIVVVPGDFLFDSGSVDLSLAAQSQLASVLATLKAQLTTTASIEGHTDSDGEDASNQALS